MALIAVIDGLARSGTTLMTALLHSQDGYSAYKAVFHEALACKLGMWPHEYARHPVISRNTPIHVESRALASTIDTRPALQDNSFQDDSLTLDWGEMVEATLNSIKRFDQTSYLSFAEWQKILDHPCESLAEIEERYQEICLRSQVHLLCFRWNQGLAFVQQWLRNENHHWIAMVRNPMDRACSHLKTHKVTWEDSLENSVSYYSNVSDVQKEKRVHVIYYEDLVAHPERVLSELIKGLELPPPASLQLNHIVSQDNLPYRNESADLVDQHGTHKVGEEFKGIHRHSLQRYKQEMPSSVISEYEQHLSAIPVLQRYFN